MSNILTNYSNVTYRKSSSQLKVRVGEWDTQTKNEPFPHQDRDVIKVITHPHFHSGSLRNDFAILILSESVQFAENVDVICLPKQDDIFDGSQCFASGWGKDTFGKNKLDKINHFYLK